MKSIEKNKLSKLWTVYLALGLFLVVGILFVVAFAFETQTLAQPIVLSDDLTADTYMTEVASLLVNADAQVGSTLIDRYECGACHRVGAGRVAPSFVGIAERAGERRPPLRPEAYLYEAIIYPSRFIVSGYANAMPANYASRLTPRELGDIIAYLLTADAQ